MTNLGQAVYMASAVLFILGIMRLRTPRTARSGNLLAAGGMLLSLGFVVARTDFRAGALVLLVAACAAALGVYVARSVRMTAMPQLVALFNGMGGGAAALVALNSLLGALAGARTVPTVTAVPGLLTLVIGSISFTGSAGALAKLQEWLRGRPWTYRGQTYVNAGVFGATVVVATLAVIGIPPVGTFTVLALAGSLIVGVLFVLPIGGADMPVIISLLNSLTGLAAAATGFVLGNSLLIVAGALVGASGTILTALMSRAMNRSIANVLFSGFGQSVGAATAGVMARTGAVRTATSEDVAMLLGYANRVIIVPGYGLAVARAQQEVKDLMDALSARQVDVRFAIHPVAGRMPGHMNVLLAEANVPYDRLAEMEEVNPEFARTDVALVIGANDVTNPAARNDPASPIYGMPILGVHEARNVVVLKRSMAPGFAGIDNDLFLMEKTLMLFGDARASLAGLLRDLRDLG